MIKGKWLSIPTAILNDEEMTRADVLIFGFVADKARNSGGEIELSWAQIQEACEVSRRTVARSIAKLEARGYIQAQRQAGGATVYKQCLLEPKPDPKPKRKKEPDMSKYEAVINRFDVPEEVAG